MKNIEFRTRAQWGYFKSALLGLAIGMLIAPGVSDIIREYDNPTGERKSVAEKLSDSVDSVMDHFVFGDRVKVMINGEVVALTRSADEGEKAYKAARLAINKDGIKPLWIETDYEPIDKDNEADKALMKEMKTLKGQELSDRLFEVLKDNVKSDKQLAYTMRIDDYTVTVGRFDDIVSVLEQAQSVYDENDEFRVGLKQPESKNVAMYEVEISEKVDDIERNVPDKIEDKKETIDGTPDDSEEGTEAVNKGEVVSMLGPVVSIEQTGRRALTAGEGETGNAEDEAAQQEGSVQGEAEQPEGSAEGEAEQPEGSAEGEAAHPEDSEEDETGQSEDSAEDAAVKSPEVIAAEAKLSAEDGIKFVGFSDRISVVETYVDPSKIKDRDTVYSEVTSPVDEPGVYVVVPGDCLSIIAEKVGMSEDKIKELNEGIENDDDIYYDDRLNIIVPTPPVEIMVEKQETYTENYYADVEYQDDGSMYIGETSVIREGEAGMHTVTDLVTYRGNIESGRKTVDEVVEVPAVAQVVLRGTKSKPTYMFPVTNWNVTSNFGYRWGRLHAGTDVGVPQGTTVRASRGGQVITAGWVGGYGNCVIIDHGDGVSTRYGHLSQVLVNVGQYVDQGDQIALSGNTGRSTGPHLHFEIRINGEAVDPLPYLYQ